MKKNRIVLSKDKKKIEFDDRLYQTSTNDIVPDESGNVDLGIDDILPKGMPLEETTDDNKKVLLYDDKGKSYWKSLSEVGKVKTVNGQEPGENGDIPLDLDYIPLSGTAEGKPLEGTIHANLNGKPIFQEIGEEVEQGLRDNKEFILSENKVGYSVNYTKNGETIVMSNIFQGLPDGNVIGSIGYSRLKENMFSGADVRFTPQGIGLNVENEGYIMCNVDYTELSLTSSDDKLLAQRGFVRKAISNFKLPTNWESPQQRFSGLEDKSADATYNKVMVLDNQGKAGTKNLDYAIPYVGANKAIDLNTQSLTHEGNLVKREGHFEKKLLKDSHAQRLKYVKLTDVCSMSLPVDDSKTGDIVITLPITDTTKWTIEVDIENIQISSAKLIISGYAINNAIPKVSTILGHDKIHSVKFCRKDGSTIIIIKRAENSTTFPYGKVNLSTIYYSVVYRPVLDVKSNYKIEFLKEEDIEGLTINKTILNKDFDRDSYLLDFRNFTNVPDFAKSTDVFKKDEATNWTNENQRWSGLVDKSADATYNKVMVLDADGKAGTNDADDFGKVKTVNGQEPDENGDVPLDLDYIPLSGTEEGKPIGGYFKIDDESECIIHKGGDGVESDESGTILSIGSELRMDAIEVGETYRKSFYSISPYSLDSYLHEENDTSVMSYTKTVNSTSISEGIYTSEGDSFSKDYHTFANAYTRSLSSDDNNTMLTQTDTSFSIEFNNQPFLATNPADIVTKALLNADTLINILTNATPEQIAQIKVLLDIPNQI